MKKFIFILMLAPQLLFAPVLNFSLQDQNFIFFISNARNIPVEAYDLIPEFTKGINDIRKSSKLPPVSLRFVTKMVIAWIKQESGFNPNAVSAVGCVGLLQICPDVWKLDSKPLYDPYINLQNGFQIFLHYLKKAHGYIQIALLYYNNGFIIVNKDYANDIFKKIKEVSE